MALGADHVMEMVEGRKETIKLTVACSGSTRSGLPVHLGVCCFGWWLAVVVAFAVANPHGFVSVEECQDIATNKSEIPPTCDYTWSPNATVTECCQVEMDGLTGNSTERESDFESPGLACCQHNSCPEETNFTVNQIIGCRSHSVQVHLQNVSSRAVGNISLATYCCRTRCCLVVESEVKKLKDRLHAVETINHQWLVILSATVALCGFVAIAFSIYMCHAHQLLKFPNLRAIFRRKKEDSDSSEEDRDGGSSSSSSSIGAQGGDGGSSGPAVSIDPPALTMVTRELTSDGSSNSSRRLSSGLRTAATYSSVNTEDDKAWLLKSAFDSSDTSRKGDPSRRGYSDISVVYQHHVQPQRR